MRRSRSPLERWTVSVDGPGVPTHLVGRRVEARAPVSGHTALLEAGLIPDPYVVDEEARAQWAHRSSWRFEHELPAIELADDERADLVFEGLDTVAAVSVDGLELAASRSMHRVVRVPLPGAVEAGATLAIDFGSALEYAEGLLGELGPRPAAYPHPYYLVRKMAASFGWDWGPDLQAAGIWRAASLERWGRARITRAQPIVRRASGDEWTVEVRIAVERSTPGARLEAHASVAGAGVRASASSRLEGDETTLTLHVVDPELWWPHDRGAQPLAGLVVTITEDEELLDEVRSRIGFRTIEVIEAPDDDGTSFALVVNGERVFARGVNWIPDDHLVDRLDDNRVRRRLSQAVDLHANLIRVWGGGVYESDSFYDACDELGLLVWQDVAMACAGYPEGEPLRSEILAEVRENAIRLAPHPSLALWCGGNENAWGFPQWHERGDIDLETDWGARYIDEWLPALLSEVDPERPYIPNSPFSPPDQEGRERWPNDPTSGTYHEWDVWNRDDFSQYRSTVPRFASEFGYQAPPSWSLMSRTMAEAGSSVDLQSDAFRIHQKADDGMGKLERGMAPHLGRFRGPVDWHAATQLTQAMAIRTAVEHYRSQWPVCAGAVIWQLNDCWPSVSWSLIDSDERPKPVWFAVRRAFADRLVTVAPDGSDWFVSVVNDSPHVWDCVVRIRRETLDGRLLAEAELPADASPRSVVRLPVPARVLDGAAPASELLVVTADELTAVALLAEPRDVAWPEHAVDASLEPHAEGVAVRVRARTAVVGLTLHPDHWREDATVDDGVIDLPAGGEVVFVVRAPGPIAGAAALLAPPALRWAAEMVSRSD
ncbi:glycoside hydrolase family 2 protein [Schumannella luteola]